MKRTALIVTALAALLALVPLAGCYRVELPEDQKIKLFEATSTAGSTGESFAGEDTVVPLEGAKELDAQVRMGVGELRLEAGGEDALEASLDYQPASWKPEVTYDVAGTTGRLDVRQPEVKGGNDLFGDVRNSWQLGLSTAVPVDLDLGLGAGESRLEFDGIDLRSLRMQMGVGDATVDFTGTGKTRDVAADIQAGVGSLTLIAPSDVGVRVTTPQRGDFGSFETDDSFSARNGAYVNDAYATSSTKIEIRLQQGIGSVVLKSAN